MNKEQIIAYIIASLPAHITGEKTLPDSWIKTNTREVQYNGVNYVIENYNCMENYGMEPAGLIATIVLNSDRTQIVQSEIKDLNENIENYSRMVDMYYGQGIDNLKKND